MCPLSRASNQVAKSDSACCNSSRWFDAVEIGEAVEVAPYAPAAAVKAMPREALLRCLDTPEVRALQ